MILNYSRLLPTAMHSEPFGWGWFDGCLAPVDGRELLRQFPANDLVLHTSSPNSDKEYTVRSLTVGKNGKRIGPALPPIWDRLVEQIGSAAFGEVVSTVTGVDVRSELCEIRLTEYGPGFAMTPHTDRADKLVTVTIYLGESWSPGDGGELVILNSADESDEHARIAPRLGSCAMLVRSRSSWHRVAAPAYDSARRRSLLVHFTR